MMPVWVAIEPGNVPLNRWMFTRRDVADDPNYEPHFDFAFARQVLPGEELEWVDFNGITTVTSHAYKPPTHFLQVDMGEGLSREDYEACIRSKDQIVADIEGVLCRKNALPNPQHLDVFASAEIVRKQLDMANSILSLLDTSDFVFSEKSAVVTPLVRRYKMEYHEDFEEIALARTELFVQLSRVRDLMDSYRLTDPAIASIIAMKVNIADAISKRGTFHSIQENIAMLKEIH